jgi:uncharacterized protein YtpQ (UPF0354 family)
MNEMLSLGLFAVLTFFFVWRMFRQPVPLNQQGIRLLFLRQLFAFRPDLRVVEENADSISIEVGTQRCDIHLEQLYRRCAELPGQLGQLIQQAIKGIEDALDEDAEQTPDWENRVFPLLMRPEDTLPDDLVTAHVTEYVSLGYVLRNDATFRWITVAQQQRWQLSADELHTLALRNLERSCSSLVIDTPGVQPDGHEHFLRFITGDGLDAARVLIPSLYGRFSPRFDDDDLLVAIPTRDTLVMIGCRDGAIANFLGYRGLWEYGRRAYPISDRLLLVTNSGLNPWPPADGQDAADHANT